MDDSENISFVQWKFLMNLHHVRIWNNNFCLSFILYSFWWKFREILSQIYLLIEFDKFYKISFNFINSISFIFPNLKLYKKEIFYIISLYNSTYCLKFSNYTHCIISYIITHRDVKNFQIILSTFSVPFSTKNRVFKFQEKFFLPLLYDFVAECIRILFARQVQWISIRWAIDTVAL